MILFLLIFCVGLVGADWPPTSTCSHLVEHTDLVITDRKSSSSKCELQETFDTLFFAKISPAVSIESMIGLNILSVDKVKLATIRMSNGKIFSDNDMSCEYFDRPLWLRVQLQPMMDTRKTNILVQIGSAKLEFSDCLSVSVENAYHQMRLSFEGQTKSMERQIIHFVSVDDPKDSVQDMSKLNRRIDLLEERLRRLQSTVAEYIHSHDKHVELSTSRHEYFKSAIAGTHNRIEARTNAHGIVYFFMFVLIGICALGYVRWKHGEEKRFHMP